MSDSEPSKKPETKENHIFDDLTRDVLSMERGLPITIWHMVKSPEAVIEAYFSDKGRYVNPFRYTIIIVAVVMLIATFFIDYEYLYRQALEKGTGEDLESLIATLSAEVPGFDWQKYFDRFLELSVLYTEKFSQITYLAIYAPMLALFSFLFFKKKRSKFSHHFVMMIYLLATYSMFTILFTPFLDETVFMSSYLTYSVIIIQLGYTYFVMKRYLGITGIVEHVKVIATFILGYASFSIISSIILYAGAFIWMKL